MHSKYFKYVGLELEGIYIYFSCMFLFPVENIWKSLQNKRILTNVSSDFKLISQIDFR